MAWLALTILAIVARGFMSIGTKLFTNYVKVSPITQTVLFMGIATIFVLIISPFIGGLSLRGLSHHILALAIILFTQCIGNILFFKGQAELDVGMTQITYSSILIWSAVFAVIILHDHFSLVQLFGIALLLVAILIAQYSKNAGKLAWPVIYILVASALYALFQVVSAAISDSIGIGTYLIWTYAGTTLVLFAVRPRQISREIKPLLQQSRAVLPTILFASGIGVAYFVFSYLAYQRAPQRAVVVVLLPAQILVSIILASIFLKERTRLKRKLAAAVLAVVAGGFIKS